MALDWLQNDPNYDTFSHNEKLERFALMTIYKSTGGETWGREDGFKLPESAYDYESECDFPYYICPNRFSGDDSGRVFTTTPPPTIAPVPTAAPVATPPPVPATTAAPTPMNTMNNNSSIGSNNTTAEPTTTLTPNISTTLAPAPNISVDTDIGMTFPPLDFPTTSPNATATTQPPTNDTNLFPPVSNVTDTSNNTSTAAPLDNSTAATQSLNNGTDITAPFVDNSTTPTPPVTNDTETSATTPLDNSTSVTPPNTNGADAGTVAPLNNGTDASSTPAPLNNDTAGTGSFSGGLPSIPTGSFNTDTNNSSNVQLPVGANDTAGTANSTESILFRTTRGDLSQKHKDEDEGNSHRELYSGSFAKGTTLNLTNQGTLQGSLPPEMALLTELQTVHISGNPGLIGTIPSEIRSWEDFLFTLILSRNSLSGTIPATIGQLRHVRTLWLNDNKFSGQLPSQLALLSQLTSLQIQNNQLTGTIPDAVASYPYVHYINWANNKISGPLPTFYQGKSNASQVREIILNNNSFTGNIPTEWGDLTTLEVLMLHSNPSLQPGASVPPAVCDLMTNHKLRYLTVDCLTVICPCQCSCPTGGALRSADFFSTLPDYTSNEIGVDEGNSTNVRSPQTLAYEWLQADPNVDSYSVDEQTQRFALATIYYATSLPPDYVSWDTYTNWLSFNNNSGDECLWASVEAEFLRIPDAATDGLPVCFEATGSSSNSTASPFESYQALRLANNSLQGTLPGRFAKSD